MLSYYLTLAVTQSSGWFDPDRLPTLIAAVVSIIIVLYTTYHRSSRERFKMREIAGLKAVEEAGLLEAAKLMRKEIASRSETD